MCGRFVLKASAEEMRQAMALAEEISALTPNYNVAPSQDIPAAVAEGGIRHLRTFRWGLVPFWAQEEKVGHRMINARSETVETSGAFRFALEKRRCVIPANGFYEWKKTPSGKQPYFIHPAQGEFFLFAGLWEAWKGKENDRPETLYSCTIITTPANHRIGELHDRMPVILTPEEVTPWLDTAAVDPTSAKALLDPVPDNAVDFYPVSTAVNHVRHNDAALLERFVADPELDFG